MIRIFFVGLLKGLLVGGLCAYGLYAILPQVMAGWLGYVFAAVVGILVGLIAGKPIWAKGASIEASLKAFVGALLGGGILFGLRYLAVDIPEIMNVPSEAIGQHPFASLMSVATILALIYEVDNGVGSNPNSQPKRVATSLSSSVDSADETERAKRSAKR